MIAKKIGLLSLMVLTAGFITVANALNPSQSKKTTTIKQSEKEGQLVVRLASKGDFTHTPQSKEGLEGLAAIAHKYGYPVTYYLKPGTVEASQANLKEWHQKYGDEVGWFSEATPFEMAEADLVTTSEKSLFNSDFNTSEWYNATVPGTVLTTLVDQGVYPDPYFGLNNLSIPDSLCRKEWWYRLPVRLPENCSGKTIWLLFNGINYNLALTQEDQNPGY